MTSESNIEKLARLYTEEGFTKEQMAEDMFKDDNCSFSLVVKVSLQMDYLK
jgi:hypothetical protein